MIFNSTNIRVEEVSYHPGDNVQTEQIQQTQDSRNGQGVHGSKCEDKRDQFIDVLMLT